jgi:hypothetical protein
MKMFFSSSSIIDFKLLEDARVTCLNSEISSDGSWGRVSGVGGSEHLAAGHDGVLALPDHGNDRS